MHDFGAEGLSDSKSDLAVARGHGRDLSGTNSLCCPKELVQMGVLGERSNFDLNPSRNLCSSQQLCSLGHGCSCPLRSAARCGSGQALGFVLFVFYCATVLTSSQVNTAEDETVDNKDERLPGTICKSDCSIPLIRVDFSTLGFAWRLPVSTT